ncbi:MAG: hypothetical protein IGR92_10330 [Leptolyngbyaceae cyanobacterium T60_A2020_046]|nr:hypothetical protein [Leptolyngbyaceae cyanobacterium T60_A2020_046]
MGSPSIAIAQPFAVEQAEFTASTLSIALGGSGLSLMRGGAIAGTAFDPPQ